MKLYLKYLSIQIKSNMEYKKDFIFSIISQILSSIFAFITIVLLFNKFGNIEGYKFKEILICFVISYAGFALAECFFRGFDHFDRFLANGEFDRMLVRPRNILLQIIGGKVELSKFGRAGVGLVILIILLVTNSELLKFDKLITIMLMIIGTIIVYACLFILKAGITFFTTQSLEIMNIFTDGGRDLSQYPLDIYHKVIKVIFTFVIPLAFVNYYPLLYIIGRTDNKLYILSPLLTIFFIIPCYIIWKIGLKKYKSIGS